MWLAGYTAWLHGYKATWPQGYRLQNLTDSTRLQSTRPQSLQGCQDELLQDIASQPGGSKGASRFMMHVFGFCFRVRGLNFLGL